MKSKRGNLLPEEVLKIIIAVICIGFLIFLLVSLYFSVTGEQKKKEAEAIMTSDNGLAKEIVRVNQGGMANEQGFLIPNPSGWYIFSFVGEDLKPNLCIGENCVCICENVVINIFNWQKRQINKCDDKGSCTIVSNLKKFDKIKIESKGTYLSISKINNEIEITKK
jgi:hypothetical protein